MECQATARGTKRGPDALGIFGSQFGSVPRTGDIALSAFF
jgi:hypothetical protein